MSPANSQVTPMMQQYLDIKSGYADSILFFRMGDFYEMFFTDAIKASKILGIALTSRDKKSGNPVPMCGVPYHSAAGYITKLIEQGLRVAICDQVEDPRLAKGIVKRQVTRIVTPGTCMDSDSLPAGEAHYIGAVTTDGKAVGLAYCDIGTGAFFATELQYFADVVDAVRSLRLRELIAPEQGLKDLWTMLRQEMPRLTLRHEESMLFHRAQQQLLEHFGVRSIAGLGMGESPAAAEASGALMGYLKQTQLSSMQHLQEIRLYRRSDSMVIDATTRRNLELTQTLRGDQGEETLFAVLDDCKTAMGTRMLRDWMERPLLDVDAINQRLDAIAALLADQQLHRELTGPLSEVQDIQRITSRLVLERGTPRDLIGLRSSLVQVRTLRQQLAPLHHEFYSKIIDRLHPMTAVVDLINNSIVDNPPASLQEDGGVIRDGYNAELDELRQLLRQGKEWIAALEKEERDRSGIANLRVRYNRVFGYYIEVTKSNLSLVPSDYERKQTLVNAERFITPQLKVQEEKILTATERISQLELELFKEVTNRVAAQHKELMEVATAVATVDVVCALAKVALENNYCRPVVDNSQSLRIIQGRHPMVERFQIANRYVPNDVVMDSEGRQILIVTGPNMAGKSTLLRQIALTLFMAQIGSFVPAAAAEFGIVDRIFSRIGASDDIAMGRSTFMVEMEETANILRNATERSLLILDEIGRGTSTYDGLSIAWAVIEYIHNRISARTLFATHYHALTRLEAQLARVHNVHVAVREQGDEVIFLHRLLDGGVSRSYGITVGRLAGLPKEVVKRAAVVLRGFEKERHSDVGVDTSTTTSSSGGLQKQISLFQDDSCV